MLVGRESLRNFLINEGRKEIYNVGIKRILRMRILALLALLVLLSMSLNVAAVSLSPVLGNNTPVEGLPTRINGSSRDDIKNSLIIQASTDNHESGEFNKLRNSDLLTKDDSPFLGKEWRQVPRATRVMRHSLVNGLSMAANSPPIYIVGDADFAAQAVANNWPGSGTASDPYIIENLVIRTTAAGTPAIDIHNTTVHFIIRNTTVTSTSSVGIRLTNVTNARLINNTALDNAMHGFLLNSSSNNVLQDNIALNNSQYGFYLISSSNNNELKDNFAQSNKRDGFYVAGSHHVKLTNNTATDNLWTGFMIAGSNNTDLSFNIAENNTQNGFYLTGTSNHALLANNTARDNWWKGFWLGMVSHSIVTGNIAYNNSQEGFWLDSPFSVNVTVLGNSAIENNWTGFKVSYTSANVLQDNIAERNAQHGFYIFSSTNITFEDNKARENGEDGFHLEGSNDNTLKANVANSNGVQSASFGNFHLLASSNNTLIANQAYNGSTLAEIYLNDSHQNMIMNNTVFNNPNFGIYMASSKNNSLHGNVIMNNRAYGLYMDVNSTRNVVVHNDFIANTLGPPVLVDEPQAFAEQIDNFFDYNHWSELTTITTDRDFNGIADDIYIIGGALQKELNDSHALIVPNSLALSSPYNSLSPSSVQIYYNNTNGSITITWQHPQPLSWVFSSVVTSYEIYRTINGTGTPFVRMGQVSSNTTTFVDNQVNPGITYEYLVVAITENADSLFSKKVSGTAPAPPPPTSTTTIITTTTTTTTTTAASTTGTSGTSTSNATTTTNVTSTITTTSLQTSAITPTLTLFSVLIATISSILLRRKRKSQASTGYY